MEEFYYEGLCDDIAKVLTGKVECLYKNDYNIDAIIEDYGGEDVNDVISMIDIILDLSFIDKKGVYMIGASRGGLMTYRACSMDDKIIAAAAISGLADCIDMYNFRNENMKAVLRELIGGSPTECPQEYIKRSAVYWADRINTPILICHGTADTRIKVEQAYNIAEKLKEAHKEYKLIIIALAFITVILLLISIIVGAKLSKIKKAIEKKKPNKNEKEHLEE